MSINEFFLCLDCTYPLTGKGIYLYLLSVPVINVAFFVVKINGGIIYVDILFRSFTIPVYLGQIFSFSVEYMNDRMRRFLMIQYIYLKWHKAHHNRGEIHRSFRAQHTLHPLCRGCQFPSLDSPWSNQERECGIRRCFRLIDAGR